MAGLSAGFWVDLDEDLGGDDFSFPRGVIPARLSGLGEHVIVGVGGELPTLCDDAVDLPRANGGTFEEHHGLRKITALSNELLGERRHLPMINNDGIGVIVLIKHVVGLRPRIIAACFYPVD